MASPF